MSRRPIINRINDFLGTSTYKMTKSIIKKICAGAREDGDKDGFFKILIRKVKAFKFSECRFMININ